MSIYGLPFKANLNQGYRYPQYLKRNLSFIIDGTYQLYPDIVFDLPDLYCEDYTQVQYPYVSHGNKLIAGGFLGPDEHRVQNDPGTGGFGSRTIPIQPYNGTTGILIGDLGLENSRAISSFDRIPIREIVEGQHFTIYANINFRKEFGREKLLGDVLSSVWNSGGGSTPFVFGRLCFGHLCFGTVYHMDPSTAEINTTFQIAYPNLPSDFFDDKYHNMIMRYIAGSEGDLEIFIDGQMVFRVDDTGFVDISSTTFIANSDPWAGDLWYHPTSFIYGNLFAFNKYLTDEEIEALIRVDKVRFNLDF